MLSPIDCAPTLQHLTVPNLGLDEAALSPSRVEVFFCDSCPRQYSSKAALKRHRNVHNRDETFLCTVCGLCFYRPDLLSRHRRIHVSPNGTKTQSRQRNCIACDRCRRSKIKCTGGLSCLSCNKATVDCTYTRQTARLSLQTRHDAGVRFLEYGSPMLQRNAQRSESPTRSINLPSPFDVSQLSHFDAAQALGDAWPLDAWTVYDGVAEGITDSCAVSTPLALHQDVAHDSPVIPPTTDDAAIQDFIAGDEESSALPAQLGPTRNVDCLLSSFPGDDECALENDTTGLMASASSRLSQQNPARLRLSREHVCDSSTLEVPFFEKSYGTWEIPSSRVDRFASSTIIQDIVVQSHIDFAVNNSFPVAGFRTIRSRARLDASTKAVAAFQLGMLPTCRQGLRCLFDHLLALFFENFHPRQPILWQQGFDSYSTSPLLILSMATLGAASAGSGTSKYAVKLLHYLRQLVLESPRPHELGLSHLLFGVLVVSAELCLGGEDSIARAQQLNVLLVHRARDLGLFDRAIRTLLSFDTGLSNFGVANINLKIWIEDEMKKRLLLGILQADQHLSKALNVAPAILQEEVDIDLPCADDIWLYTGHDWHQRILEASLL